MSSGINGLDMVVEKLLQWKKKWKDKNWWTECRILEIEIILVIDNDKNFKLSVTTRPRYGRRWPRKGRRKIDW